MYNITDPSNVEYVDYINTRDFSEDIAGDVSPEGLAFVGGEKPMLLVGHEVSGTVTVYDLLAKHEDVVISFKDIDNHFAKEAIITVTQAKLFSGVSKSAFAPNKDLTHSQAGLVFNGLAVATNNTFTSPENISSTPVTREEFAVMVYEYLQSNSVTFDTTSTSNYIDDAKISEEAKQAVYALESKGIMTGSNGLFNPTEKLTRGQAAIVFSHLLNY